MEKHSTAAIREAAAQWTLAGDKRLLDILQNIHQGLMTRCQEVNQRLDEMVAALDDASVDLQNVNNKFMALSNSQFVESRVYDDDADVVDAHEPAKESLKPVDSSAASNIRASVHVLHGMHETIRILPSDTDSDSDDEDTARMVLKPKDMYSHRPLPHIIGSQAWKSKWHAGLLVEDSDSDSVVSKPDRDEYSDSEPETPRADPLRSYDEQESMTGSEVLSEQDLLPPAKPSSAEVAAELARRLRGDLPEIPDEEVDFSPVPPATRKVYRPEKPAPGVIFSDDPPPFYGNQSEEDQYSQEEDDDIFAELHKNKPYRSNNKVQNAAADQRSLKINKDYQGDLFDDLTDNTPAPPLANQKTTLFEDESESELFAPKPTVKETSEKRNVPPNVETVKKPIGGISLFGSNKGTESIGAAILKRHQRKSSCDEEKLTEEPPKPIAKEDTLKTTQKDIFDNLFAKSVKEQKTTEDVKTTNVVSNKESKVNKVDLFSDNIFDDIDDIFTTDVVKVTTKPSGDKQKSLFDDDDDDDDLFSGIAVVKGKVDVKIDDKKTSLFESDDELFSDKVVKTEKTLTQATESVSKSSISKTTELSKKNIITYEEDSSDNDIFSKSNEAKVVNARNSAADKEVSKTQLLNVNKLLNEEIKNSADSLQKKPFTNNAVNNNVTIQPSAQTSVVQDNIFGDINDDSDDLFKESNKNTSNNSNKVNKNNDMAKSKPSTANKAENENRKKKISLFEDDDDDNADLFSSSSNKLLSNKVEDKNNKTANPLNKEKEMFNDNQSTDISNAPNKAENNNVSVNSVISSNPDNNDKNDINNKTDSFQHKNTLFNNDSNDNLFGKNDDNIFKKEPPVSTIIPDDISRGDKDDKQAIKEKIQDNIDTLSAKEIIPSKHSSDDSNIKPSKNVHSTEQRNINFIKEEVNSELPEPDFAKPNPEVIEEDIVFPTAKDDIFNVSDDIFSKITDEPPAFEKPKESKKSKNVNALFDDDSDDEALFFKKNDVVFDELPDVSADSNDPLFGIFHDEPPAIDVEFNPKGSDKNLFQTSESLQSSSKETSSYNFNDPFSDDEITTTKSFKTETETLSTQACDTSIHQKFEELNAIDDFLNTDSDDTLFNTEKSVEKTTSIPGIATKPIHKDIETHTKAEMSQENIDQHTKTDLNTETVTSRIQPSSPKRESLSSDTPDSPETKKIGKLKTMNFNIDVSTLLPGASPKKKVVEQTDGHAISTNNQEEHVQNRRETMVKAVSFDGDPESQVLDNKLSKERAKIQVKRRPSTRRARKDAVRQSVLDQGEDSTDNSNSIDDTPKIDIRKETTEPENDSDLEQSVSKDNKEDNEDLFINNVDPKKDIPPESHTTNDIFATNDIPTETVIDIKPDTSSVHIQPETDTTNDIFATNGIPTETIIDIKPDTSSVHIQPESDTTETVIAIKADTSSVHIPTESDTTNDIFASNDNTIERVIDIKPDTSFVHIQPKTDTTETFFDIKAETSSVTKPAEDTKTNTNSDNEIVSKTVETKTVTSKIVYILNDEDIFNTSVKKTKEPTNILNLSDDDSDDLFKGLSKSEVKPGTSTLGNIYKDNSVDNTKTDDQSNKITSLSKNSVLYDLSDDENELFNSKKVAKPKGILDSDSDEDLFSGKSEKKFVNVALVKEVKQPPVAVKKSLFGDDDDDDDLFGAKVKVEHAASFQPRRSQKEAATKPSEPELVFDDPLSMLGGDDD